ncbi:MAG: insulinase family protein [Candidatus Lambdaproteobacteria bacterium]|nr:insulinase family protein [Candidatus Lambdaproteobacteria bacterium]
MELVQELKLLDAYPVRHFRWPNGLQALLVHNPISPVVAFLTHYTVGSASEHEHQRGLAHFFEHMMFRETGTLKDGDFDRIVAEAGGVGLNAFTSYDTTAYHVNVPSRSLARVVEIEADRMVNLRLSGDLIEKERGAVLGELHMYHDMPSEQLWNTLMAHAFSAHPYRHPVIGYEPQVAAFRHDDFQRFYREHYAPNRAVLVIAGGFEEEATLELVDGAYGGLAPGGPRPASAPPDAPPARPARVEIAHEKISSEYLYIATHSPGIGHPDLPALHLLSAVLSAGLSSPLHRRIVLEGLGTQAATHVLELSYQLASPGLFLIEIDLQHGVAAERAEEALAHLLAGLEREGIPPAELERAQNQLRLGYFSALRTNMSLAREVGGYMMACGDPEFGQRHFAALQRVTPAQVQEALRRYLIDPARVVVIQRPSGSAPA